MEPRVSGIIGGFFVIMIFLWVFIPKRAITKYLKNNEGSHLTVEAYSKTYRIKYRAPDGRVFIYKGDGWYDSETDEIL